MPRRVLSLLACLILCLCTVPVLAAPKATTPTPTPLMEEVGDLAFELQEWLEAGGDSQPQLLVATKDLARLRSLLKDDAGEMFITIGTARSRAMKKNKPAPTLSKIKGVQPIPLDASADWAAELEAEMEALQEKLDSLNEMDEMQSLRLQMAMDRLSKMMSTLSNLLKKISDTQESITQNIK